MGRHGGSRGVASDHNGGMSSGIGGSRGSSNVGNMTAHERGVRGGWENATGTPSNTNSDGEGKTYEQLTKEWDAPKGRTAVGGGLFQSADGKTLYNGKGEVVGRQSLFGSGNFMTATKGWQHGPNRMNSYGIHDKRNSYFDGYRGAKENARQAALSGWNNYRTELMQNMHHLPHAQRDSYLTAFDNAQFDQIPDQLMGSVARQGAQGALDSLNGPVMSALGYTQTPAQAIGDLARDLTFDEQGDMGLKPGAVYERMLGETRFTAPTGAAAMGIGQAIGGLGGKITSALGQVALMPGPTEALGVMSRTLGLAQTAHVAGVKSPDRNTFMSGTSSGGNTLYPQSQTYQTAAARSPISSQPARTSALNFGELSPYSGYGYTLI